jgi:hypothetical protein
VSGHLLVRFADAVPGQHDACASWHRDVRLSELLATDGFNAGQVLTRSEGQAPPILGSGDEFLTACVVSSEPDQLLEAVGRSALTAQPTPGLEAPPVGGPWIYTPIGERRGSAARGEHLVFAGTSAMPGRDDELNDWYDNTHIAEALGLPGFLSGQRFRLADTQLPGNAGSATHHYLALYETTGPVDTLWSSITTFPFSPTSSVDFGTAATTIYTSIAHRGSLAVS